MRKPKNLPMLSPVGGKALLTMRRMSLENTSPSSQANPPIFSSNQKMFDQMFIFGGSPEKSSNGNPVILTMFPSTEYPQNDDDFEFIKKQCFPNGFEEISDDFPPSQTIISEFVFFLDSLTPTQANPKTKIDTNDSISNEFNNDRIFGIVVQFRAPPDFTPFFATTLNRHFPYALCILSRKFYLSSHIQFATYVSLVLAGRAAAVQNRVRAPHSVKGFCHPKLALDKKTPAVAVFPGFSAPIHLLDIISKYLSRPTEPQPTPFNDAPYSYAIPMSIPLNMTMMQCISYPSTDILFSCLKIEQIVSIYEAVILEKKVAFVSRDPHNSSLCVLACMSITRPFRTFSEFIPVLTLHDSSSVTSPIVCGIHCRGSSDCSGFLSQFDVVAVVNNTNETANSFTSPTASSSHSLNSESHSDTLSEASTFLSLVSHSIDQKESCVIFAKKLPKLPHYDEIVRKIGLVIQNRIEQVKVPQPTVKPFFGKAAQNPSFLSFLENSVEPFAFVPFYLMQHPQKFVFTSFLVDSIREIFAGSIALELNEKIVCCSKKVGFVDTEKLAASFVEDERPFITDFAKTKTFDDFLKRAMRQMQRKNLYDSPSHSSSASHFKETTVKPAPFPACSRKISIKSPTAPFSPFTKEEVDE